MIRITITERYEGHYISVEAEAETEAEARKIAEKKIEEAKRQIDEMQSKCKHEELEFIDYNAHFNSYRFRCKKCGKIIYKGGNNPFGIEFFEAWRKGLITIPRGLGGMP